MKKGFFEIKDQIDEYGFFGAIELTCIINGNSNQINIILPDKFEQWRPGILFGATYLIENVLEQVDLTIEITNIEFYSVDTNNTILAYLTFNAILDAIKLPVRNFVLFNKQNKSFIFPK